MTTGFCYLWANKVNGMVYVGAHCGYPKDCPKYIAGSNYFLKNYYGHSRDFARIILYQGPHYKDFETFVLTLCDARNDPMFYNKRNTAGGGKGADNGMYGRKRTLEEKALISRRVKEAYNNDPELRKKCGNGTYLRGEEHHWYGRRMTGKNNPMYGRKRTPQEKIRMRAGQKRTSIRKAFYWLYALGEYDLLWQVQNAYSFFADLAAGRSSSVSA